METIEYSSSDEEDSYGYSQDSYYNETRFVESWHDDGYSSCSDFEEEPYGGAPEPEPPDRYSSSYTKPSYPKPWISWNPIPKTNSYPIFYPTRKVIYKLFVHSGSKTYGPEFFLFSGLGYLQWESNMNYYFEYHSTPQEDKLSIALGQLKSSVLRWWDQDEYNRWCKGQAHIAKDCPTKKGSPKQEPTLCLHPQVLQKQVDVSTLQHDQVQTEACQIDYNVPMTVLMHLSSAKSIEKVSGTKEIIKDQGKVSTMEKVFTKESQNQRELTLKKVVVNKDESVKDTIQIKEEPPIAQQFPKTQCKLLNPYTLQWTNLTYLCVEPHMELGDPLRHPEQFTLNPWCIFPYVNPRSQDFPFPKLNEIKSQRLYFDHLLGIKKPPTMTLDVPKSHHFQPKLSRLKTPHNFPYLADFVIKVPTAIFSFIVAISLLL
ncbi:unnamed protein product [Arabidopsis thaliana]|uniref:Uncharacterized protein n=1 Tax=Arabidopsis thaliana TaxID=3702 RepID=A0A654FH67_ARATH|nr:unnamed protein product [Arabidopsis thaliana]